jgi:hypothetical protein
MSDDILGDWSLPHFALHCLINECKSDLALSASRVKEFIGANKCDVTLADSVGVTPLHEAAGWGQAEVVKLLLQLGADINAQDKNGWTPLIHASFVNSIYRVGEGMLETAKILVENGADKTIKCNEGKTAADYAKEIYFARSIYYFLCEIPEYEEFHPILSSRPLGRPVVVRLKEGARYYMLNGYPIDCSGNEVVRGVLTKIWDIGDEEYLEDAHGASSTILHVTETDAGIPTSNSYKFHHDDVDLEVLGSDFTGEKVEDQEYEMGFIVDVKSRRSESIFYRQNNKLKILPPNRTFVGYFGGMTGRRANGTFELAHIDEVKLVDHEKNYSSIKKKQSSMRVML